MRAIAPRTGAPEQTIAEDQPEYLPVTVGIYGYADGATGLLTRWTFTPEERAAIAGGEDVYLMQLYFPGADEAVRMTPLIVRAGPGDFTLGVNG